MFSPSVCPASGCAEWKTENVEEEEDREEVFTVELHRGPHGLGLALVDGTVWGLLHSSSSNTHPLLLILLLFRSTSRVKWIWQASSYLDCLKSAFLFSHNLIRTQKKMWCSCSDPMLKTNQIRLWTAGILTQQTETTHLIPLNVLSDWWGALQSSLSWTRADGTVMYVHEKAAHQLTKA